MKGVVVDSRFQCLLLRVGWSTRSAIMTTVRIFEVHGVLRGGSRREAINISNHQLTEDIRLLVYLKSGATTSSVRETDSVTESSLRNCLWSALRLGYVRL